MIESHSGKRRRHGSAWSAGTAIAVALILSAGLDALTGNQASPVLFYLLAIGVATYSCGTTAGLFAAMLALPIWHQLNGSVDSKSVPFGISAWNAISRFVILAIGVGIAEWLRDASKASEDHDPN